jgi:hypothetical protein
MRLTLARRWAHLRAAFTGTYRFMPPSTDRCRKHNWATSGIDSCPSCYREKVPA